VLTANKQMMLSVARVSIPRLIYVVVFFNNDIIEIFFCSITATSLVTNRAAAEHGILPDYNPEFYITVQA
jgi:hypothetical protein